MKRILIPLIVLSLLLSVGTTVAFAGQEEVEKGPPGVIEGESGCGIWAGDYGWFVSPNYYWAVYSPTQGVLKCVAQLAPDQTPPASMVIAASGDLCGTPGGFTYDSLTKVFPDGFVHLICRTH